MPTIERSIQVAALPQPVFDYLRDVERLPDYFPDIIVAEPRDGDTVHVEARIPDGSVREAEAQFDVDDDARRIEWRGSSHSDYHGWLEVSAAAQGARVDLGITMAHDDVDNSIGRTLETIRQQIEERDSAG